LSLLDWIFLIFAVENSFGVRSQEKKELKMLFNFCVGRKFSNNKETLIIIIMSMAALLNGKYGTKSFSLLRNKK